MVGVAKYDLRLDLFNKFREMNSFNRACSTNGHKDGCLYLSVVCSY